MPSSHCSLASQPRSVADEAFERIQEKLLIDSAWITNQLAESLQKRNAIRNPPDDEAAARISSPGILIQGVATGPVARTMSSLPSAIPGPGSVLRRSSRLAVKVKERYYDTTDPGFLTTGTETEGQDLNPSHAAKALPLLSLQPRSDPFNDAEMADSVREGWCVTNIGLRMYLNRNPLKIWFINLRWFW